MENYITTYPKDGTNKVEKISYDNGIVWINDKQYFNHFGSHSPQRPAKYNR